MADLYQLSADFLSSAPRVLWFEGDEAMSGLYRFSVTFSLPLDEGLALDLDGATGKRAKLTVMAADGSEEIAYHGTVAGLDLVDDLGGVSVLRAHLVPKLWQLGLGEHSRVFVDRTLPEIIDETLRAGGLSSADFEIALVQSYPKLAHVCQYRESRLAFIARWLERVAACWFFQHGSDGEKLVITDDLARHASCRDEAVRYFASAEGDVSAEQALRVFRWQHDVQPKTARVKDYSYLNPALEVVGDAPIVASDAGGDLRLFGVNEDASSKAKSHAEARARERLASRTSYRGRGRVLRLTPGFSFQLDEHPRADLCKKYLLTRVRHVGFESGARDIQVGAPAWLGEALDARETYRCEIEAVDAATRWAPRATTPWPRIGGSLRARVDGPIDSAYAQIDEHGRYLVRLLLDESDLPAGGASTRIRMLQPHSGNPEGLHLPLRKDTEVQIVFLKGDPDQPVIAGVVPNKLTASPVTASNKSQNVLQTGGLNRVEMEDQEGSEYIDLSTVPQKTFAHLGAHAGLGSHNYVFSTDGDYAMHTGGNRDIRVGGKQTERVDGNVDEKYHADQTTHVFGALDETIDAGAQQKIHAGSTQTIDGGATQTISGGETRSVTGGQTESIDGGRTQSISGSSTETISGSLDQTVTGAIDITINGGQVVVASGGFELNTPAMVTLTAAGGFNLLAPGGQTRIDEDFNQFGREYTILAPNQFVKTANRIDLRALYLEGVVVKVDIFGVKRTVGASQKSTAAAYLGAGGCYTWKGAMFKRSAALQSVGG